jgi:Multiubiquitin
MSATPTSAEASTTDEHHEKHITIFLNAERKEVTQKVLTYADVVFLEWGDSPPSGPNVQITITFKKAEKPHEGSLLPGSRVEVKDGTRFNVRATDKS